MGNRLQTHLENIETKLGGEVSSEHKDLGQHLEYIESLLGEGGSGGGGIQLKTINGESIIGTGNIEISGGGGSETATDADIDGLFADDEEEPEPEPEPEEYSISVEVENGSWSGDETISEGGTAEIEITPNKSYVLYEDYYVGLDTTAPSIEVTGADFECDYKTCIITLSNPTGPVSVTVHCEYDRNQE